MEEAVIPAITEGATLAIMVAGTLGTGAVVIRAVAERPAVMVAAEAVMAVAGVVILMMAAVMAAVTVVAAIVGLG